MIATRPAEAESRWPSLPAEVVLCSVGAGLVALSAANQPAVIALLVMGAVPLIYLAVVHPPVALATLLVVQVSGINMIVGSHAGLNPSLVALAVAVLSLVFAARRGEFRLGRSPMYLPIAGVALAETVSILNGPAGGSNLAGLVETMKDVGFFFTLVALLRTTGRYRSAVRVVVITVALLAGLSVVQQYGLHNSTTFGGFSNVPLGMDIGAATARHSGPEADVNFWGRTLVLFFPMALSLWAISRSSRRWLWLAAAAILAWGEYLTQSRGGILAFGLAFTAWLVFAGRRYHRLLILVPLIVGSAVLLPGVSSRLSTLTQLQHVSASQSDPSLVERVAAQRIAAAMFVDHPMTGVGYGNYIKSEPAYLYRPDIQNTGVVLAPHNLYLQLAAEQGVLGLTAWAMFFGGALLVSLRVLLLPHDAALRQRLLASGIIAGQVAWAAASIFLHMADLRNLLVLVAVATGLDIELRRPEGPVASQGLSATATAAKAKRAGWRRGHAAAIGLMVASVVGAAELWALNIALPHLHLQQAAYTADARAEIRPPAAPPSGADAYAWDTISRRTLLPTYVAIVANPRFQREAAQQLGLSAELVRAIRVRVAGDPSSAVITVSVRAPNASVATVEADSLVQQAYHYFVLLPSPYRVEPLGGNAAARLRVYRGPGPIAPVALAILALLAAAGAGLGGRRAWLHRPEHVRPAFGRS